MTYIIYQNPISYAVLNLLIIHLLKTIELPLTTHGVIVYNNTCTLFQNKIYTLSSWFYLKKVEIYILGKNVMQVATWNANHES